MLGPVAKEKWSCLQICYFMTSFFFILRTLLPAARTEKINFVAKQSYKKATREHKKNIYKSPCIQLLSHDTILIRVTFRSKKGYLVLN